MVTFPKLDQFYKDWAADLRSKGVEIQLNTDVTAITRSKTGVTIQSSPFDPNKRDCQGEHIGPPTTGDTYDDITITHSDHEYFDKIYETKFTPELCAKPKSKTQENQIKFAKNEGKGPDGEPGGFRPMYYTHSYKSDPEKIEMSFDCSNYQHQFRMSHDTNKTPMPYEQHVFQSIFQNKTQRHLWTIDQIDESKIIERKWWHQLGHKWQHYVRVVPGMMFINGKNRTWFAGSWTLVNMHELACVSGIAVAYRLGADYVKFDDFAETFFSNYLLLSHGVRYKSSKKEH